MQRFAFAALALVSTAGFATAEDVVPPAPAAIEPVPMQAADNVIVSESPVVHDHGVMQDQGVIVQDHGVVVQDQGVVVQDSQPVYQQPVYQQQTQATTYRQPVRRSTRSQGVFGRMMELERRKNAWLRKTFLNR